MIGIAVDSNPGQGLSAEGVVRQHALDGNHHGLLRVILHEGGVLDLLKAADPAAVMAVVFVLELVAG